MKIKKFVVSMMVTNCYVVYDEKSFEGIIIDPGAEEDKIIDFISKEKINIKAIVLTHAHFDHIGALKDLIDEYSQAPLLICEGEEIVLRNSEINLSSYYGEKIELKADRILKDGEEFSFSDCTFKTIHTPGHTPGGACFYFEKEKVLFSGDTLFFESIGRTDFELGSLKSLIKAINEKLIILPEDVTVYSGHGIETNIGHEKRYNPFLSESEF